MEHHHHHWLEKLQVQLVTAGGLFAVYYLAWPIIRPNDPLAAMAFLPMGGMASAAAFAGVFCILVAICALATIAVRPVAALLAATLAAGGASLRSDQIRKLFWTRQADMSGLYSELMLEAVMLALLAVLATLIVFLVRRLVGAVKPTWLWTDPLTEVSLEQRQEVRSRPIAKASKKESDGIFPTLFVLIGGNFLRELMYDAGKRGTSKAGQVQPLGIAITRAVACAGLATVVSVLLLFALLRSADRGQIIFALVASFSLGVFAGQQVFPSPHSLVIFILPMLVAVGFYTVAWAFVTPGEIVNWAKVNVLFRALPVDWLTAGGGGALLGFWASQRVHEFRLVHHHHEQEQGAL